VLNDVVSRFALTVNTRASWMTYNIQHVLRGSYNDINSVTQTVSVNWSQMGTAVRRAAGVAQWRNTCERKRDANRSLLWVINVWSLSRMPVTGLHKCFLAGYIWFLLSNEFITW